MNTIAPLIKPITDAWDYYTEDQTLAGITKYKRAWHTKYLQSERLKHNEVYTNTYNRMFKEPEWLATVTDNGLRFTLLAFVERLVTVRQAQLFLRSTPSFGTSTSGSLNAVRSQGLVFGAFRGNLLNLLHFSAVYYHPLVLSKGSALQFMAYSTIFEALLYPLDTIKTIVYADTKRSYRDVREVLSKNIERQGYGMLYRGLAAKLLYNLFFGANLLSISNDSNFVYLTTPLWLLSYSLLTLKTRSQIADTTLCDPTGSYRNALNDVIKNQGLRHAYAGIVPFVLLNVFAAYQFPSLYSSEKKDAILSDLTKNAPGRKEKNWAQF